MKTATHHQHATATGYKRSPLSRLLGYSLLLGLLYALSSCANVDRNLMKVSNAISSPDPVTGAREINMMSEQAEVNQGLQSSRKLLKAMQQKGLRYDKQLAEYPRVQNVFQRLRQVTHRQNLPWEVHLVGDKTWNAFTVGGGKIFLFQGLMQGPGAIQGDAELAVVLAHEMAHNTARHIGERQGKTLLTQLADKKTRNSLYKASWSSNQEHEADKFSVIYMALAGYDPMAAVSVWARMARLKGNFSANMLHSHPLNSERAQRLHTFATQARQYYIPGQIHPQAAQLAVCNNIYCNRSGQQRPTTGGDGSGTFALLETVANAYVETQAAKAEAARRAQMKAQQVQLAARVIRLSEVKMTQHQGKPSATGYIQNTSNRNVQNGVVRIQYLLKGKVVHQQAKPFPALPAGVRKPFTLPLKTGQYDDIKLIPEYVQ